MHLRSAALHYGVNGRARRAARSASGSTLASLLEITTLCNWVRARKESSGTLESHIESSTGPFGVYQELTLSLQPYIGLTSLIPRPI
jgi:hypothetical protein